MRGLLGLDGRGAKRRRPRRGAALADGLVAEADAVFLNDLLDLPQPAELRALYDAMDNASRNRGKRETVARLVDGRAPAAPAPGRRGPALGGPAHARAPGRAHRDGRRLPGPPGDDHAQRGRPARPGLARRGRRRPLLTIDLGPLDAGRGAGAGRPFLAADAALAERCVERAAGNPLFLEQLLRHAEEEADAAVPGSVRSLVQARLDRLDPADKAALQAASVLGQRFDAGGSPTSWRGPATSPTASWRTCCVRPRGRGLPLRPRADPRRGLRRPAQGAGAASCTAGRPPGSRTATRSSTPSTSTGPRTPRPPRAYLAAARAQAAGYRYETALRLVRRGLGARRGERGPLALASRGRHAARPGRHAEALVAYGRALDWPRTTPDAAAPGSGSPR